MNEELLKFNNGISGMLMRADLGDFDGNKLVIGGREINCQAFQLLDREKISAVFLFLLTCDEPERPDTASELKRSVERIAMLDHARRELAYRIVEGRVASAVVHIEGSMKTEPIAENLSPVFGPGYYGMDLNVDKYVLFNFKMVSDLVNAVDGITVDVKSNEVQQLNKYTRQTANNIGQKKYNLVKKAGKQKLEGVQAVAYGRIRKGCGDDFKRTSRMRIVIKKVTAKLQKSSISTILDVMDTCYVPAFVLDLVLRFYHYGCNLHLAADLIDMVYIDTFLRHSLLVVIK